MRIPKDCKKVEQYLTWSDLEGPVSEVATKLAAIASTSGITGDAEIVIAPYYGEAYLVGFRPMTDKELEKRDKARASAQKRAKTRQVRQREADQAELERLASKLGVELPEQDV